MEARQLANIVVKLEPGTEKPMVDAEGRAVAHLPEGVPRVTGLGGQHLEIVEELQVKAKLSVEDFAGILDHLPLYTELIKQLNYAEQCNVSVKTIMTQINDVFTRQEEDMEESNDSCEETSDDNEYDYNDGFLVRDDEVEEEVQKPKKRVLDPLDRAEMLLSYKKHQKKAEKYRKLLGIKEPKNKRKLVKGTLIKGKRCNPIKII